MKKYFCDLCEKETQALEYHDFSRFVQIEEVGEHDEDEFFTRFYVCKSCRDIWVRLGAKFVELVKEEVKKRSPA